MIIITKRKSGRKGVGWNIITSSTYHNSVGQKGWLETFNNKNNKQLREREPNGGLKWK